MKKLISLVLCVILVLSLVALVGCGEKKSETLKFGLGVYSYLDKVKNAEAEKNGSAEAVTAAATVLVDKDGKIVKCVLDVAANTVEFTVDGKFVEAGEFKTKYEMGDAYGMKAYGGAAKEWYEQADAFASVVVGKTAEQVKALVAADFKGTDEVVNAGCTIDVSDFVFALENAMKNAADSNATAEDTLKLGVVSTQTGSKDATEESDGVNEVDTTVTAVALGKDGKIVVAATDAVQAKVGFTLAGAATSEDKAVFTTKKAAGANYGMAQYGTDMNGDGQIKEWFEQGAAFDAACAGKSAAELAALAADTGYGNADLQAAGCTVHIGDMLKAAQKAATVA